AAGLTTFLSAHSRRPTFLSASPRHHLGAVGHLSAVHELLRIGLAVSIGFSYSCSASAWEYGAVFHCENVRNRLATSGGGVACRRPPSRDSTRPGRSCRRKPHAARRGASRSSASLAESTS